MGLLAILLSISVPTFAYDISVDGFYYNVSVSDMTATLVAGEQEYTGTISVPDKVTYKGRVFSVIAIDGAFANNKDLTQITIPLSVTSLGDKTFKGCAALQNIQGIDSITVFGDSCFAGCKALTAIPFSANLKSIGKAAFADCSALTDISLPENIDSIGTRTFSGCASLSHIEIPAKAKSICDYAFAGCSALQTISIPGSVEEIGTGVFQGCSGITSVTFESGATSISCGLNQIANAYNGYTSTPLFADCNIQTAIIKRNISSYHTKSSYTDNQFGCFAESNISSVIFSDGVTYIETGAFKNCSKLTKIIIPSCVSSIGDYAFYAAGLDSIIIEDSRYPLYFGNSYNLNYYGADCPNTFNGTSISSAYIGRNIETRIGGVRTYNKRPSAFFPSTLKELVFGDYVSDVTELLYYNREKTNSLSHYPNLKQVQFGASLAELPNLADNSSLEKLSMSASIPPTAKSFSNAQYIDLVVEVPTGCMDAYKAADVWKNFWEIKENAELLTFFEVDGVKYHILSDGKSVEVFGGNEGVDQITIPEKVDFAGKTYDVVSIGESAFSGNTTVQAITLNCKIQEIYPYTFANCTKLSVVQMPSTVTEIGGAAFYGCSSLKTFNCPNSLVTIGDQAFAECDSLTSFVADNVTTIGDKAFYNCKRLEDVDLGENLYSIGDEAFCYCNKLHDIYLGKKLYSIGDNAFTYCYLYSIRIPNSVEHIGTNAFYNETIDDLIIEDGETPLYFPSGSKLGETEVKKKVVNGKTVRYKIVYYEGFWHPAYSGAETLYIGRNLTDKSRYTISGDGGVDEYVITSYDAPFANLPRLKNLVIGENVKTLGPTAEYIKEIDLNISAGSFKYCSALDTVTVKAATPPTGAEFNATTYEKALLIVPDNTLALYQSADGWKEFQHIVTESSTSIEDVSVSTEANCLRINANGFTLLSDRPLPVRVYGINGNLYNSALMQPGQSVSLLPGMYIIKVDDKVVKVKI